MTDQGGAGGKQGFASRFSKGGSFAQRSGGAGGAADTGGFSKLVSKTENPAAFTEDKGVLRSRKAATEGFAKAAKKSRLDCLFLVRGKDRGKAAWHYVLVDKPKLKMFVEDSKTGAMDVALYGEILYSGWGENPPEDIVQKIKDEFGA